jgi:hypothetical protein
MTRRSSGTCARCHSLRIADVDGGAMAQLLGPQPAPGRVSSSVVRRDLMGNSPHMPSLSPDERARPPVLKAGWLRQTFLHWPFRPADVQVLLPPGLLVDEYDGMAWVSLTPF